MQFKLDKKKYITIVVILVFLIFFIFCLLGGAEPETMLVLCNTLLNVHQFNIRNRELRKNNSHLCIS